MKLFGHFIHHRRARTPEEFAEISSSYSRTKRTYAKRYGSEPPLRFWGHTTNAASMCGGGGGSNKGNPAPAGPSQSQNSNLQSQNSSLNSTDIETIPPATNTSVRISAFVVVMSIAITACSLFS